MTAAPERKAILYRMVMDKHVCPYGVKSLWLLKRHGFAVEDHHLTTREETDAFKAQAHVTTTPQTFIDGVRIGGHDDLRRYFGLPDADATSYRPVITVFGMTAAMALAITGAPHTLSWHTLQVFIALGMCVLAILKLQNVESFSTMFTGYDLLARRWVPYAYIYPFAEALAGVLMLSGRLTWLSAPLAFFIGAVGAVSVVYAVYVQKRNITCACVGGASKVPLGPVSLTENLTMMAMAIWMITI
ncbi:MAG TPA: glutaredoxin [Rhizomicrobium sp.]|nr:glutaredoxin [Rhizomicrobium sp.]